MASCLDNIISVKDVCNPANDTPSLSGLDLFDAPEISTNTLAKMANEEYVTGLALARAKVGLATKLVKNDLQSAMAANNVLPNITDIKYNAATFNAATVISALAVNRGLILHRNPRIKGRMNKCVIETVWAYPLVNATGVSLTITDNGNGGVTSTYNVDLIAGEANKFTLNYLVQGTFAQVYINGDGLSFSSSYLTCFSGCNGALPNACGYVKSYYNGKEISGREGYGISIDFKCACDYDELLCGLSKGVLGNIIWLKSRLLLLEELIKTDRLNNWTVYNREESKEYYGQLNGEYVTAWNTFVNSLPNILANMQDECLDCRGIRWMVNV